MTREEEAVKKLDTMWEMLEKAYDEIPSSIALAFTMATNALKAQPEIVRCEDCRFCHKSPDWKHLQSFGSSIWYCGKSRGLNSAGAVEPDDYCSSGVRRIDEMPSVHQVIIRCKDCNHWMPYDWMFSEVRESQNINDYPEDEFGCIYRGNVMHADDFCSKAERRTDERQT